MSLRGCWAGVPCTGAAPSARPQLQAAQDIPLPSWGHPCAAVSPRLCFLSPQPTTPYALPGRDRAGQMASLYSPLRGDPCWAGLAPPSASGRSRLLAGSSRDLQPHKQTLLEPS